jgi:endoglucanase
MVSYTSCAKKDNTTPPPAESAIAVSPSSLNIVADGGTSAISVSMNGSYWVATSDQTWCTFSPTVSYTPNTQVSVTAASNSTKNSRTANLTFKVDAKKTVYATVVQAGQTELYPDYSNPIAPDATGMGSTAKVLAAKMFAGWNLGNTLEATGGETAWGNPLTTQRFIDSVKATGINAIRIPCGWNSYIENTATCKLSASWLARVKEVVDYCIRDGMYAIINIHWDGGWLENNPTLDKQYTVNAKQKALWQQIAVNFRDYDEHLLFAGTNEVNTGSVTPVADNFTVQMSFNQTFVDAVRSTGGKNSYRNLIIQAFNTNIDLAVAHLIVSNDTIKNRLMVEVHYYDPWEFCGLEADATWGTVKYNWGAPYSLYGSEANWGQEDYVITQFQKMKTNFVDKGYPVILGEFGALRRSTLTGTTLEHHLGSRAWYFQYVAQKAKTYGLVPFYWDNGSTANFGCAMFNRSDGSTFDRQALNAYITGVTAGSYPF